MPGHRRRIVEWHIAEHVVTVAVGDERPERFMTRPRAMHLARVLGDGVQRRLRDDEKVVARRTPPAPAAPLQFDHGPPLDGWPMRFQRPSSPHAAPGPSCPPPLQRDDGHQRLGDPLDLVRPRQA